MHNRSKLLETLSRLLVRYIFFKDKVDVDYEEKKGLDKLIKELDNPSIIAKKLQYWDAENKKEQVDRLRNDLKYNDSGKYRKKISFVKLKSYISYAAIFILLVTISYFVHKVYFDKNTNRIVNISGFSDNMANLILNTGEVITIKSNETIDLSKSSKIFIDTIKNTEKIKVENISNHNLENRYHTLQTPKGGGYTIGLSDGTSVRLNAASKFRFPPSFNGNKRIVYLEGEAFFDVARDENKPFIVITSGLSVDVLGTKFNVKAYNGDEEISTTLVSGSVKIISNNKDDLYLEPNEQSIFDKSKNTIVKHKVDLSSTLAWMNGRFIFKDERLENILKQISRWYDVDVVYDDIKFKNYRFTGDIDRFKDIGVIISMLNETYTVKLLLDNSKKIIVSDIDIK